MGLEDELGAIMHEHDAEAPRAADQPDRPWAQGRGRPRRNWLLPAAAAAAVLLIGAGTLAVARHGTDSGHDRATAGAARSTACPTRYAGLDGESTKPSVPAKPAGIDTGGRLVPDITPDSVLICAYSANPSSGATAASGRQRVRRHVYTGDLDLVRAALTSLPPTRAGTACGGSGLPTDDQAALVRLTYPGGGVVWVAAPGHDCAHSSNGVVTVDGIFASVHTAATTDRWPAGTAPAAGEPCGGTTGRFGQQGALVPATPVRATVCTIKVVPVSGGTTNRTTKRTAVTGSALTDLVRRLDALDTRPAVTACSGGPLGTPRFEVLFAYADGPPVSVGVDTGNTCFGDLSNGTLSSRSSATVLPVLDRLTR